MNDPVYTAREFVGGPLDGEMYAVDEKHAVKFVPLNASHEVPAWSVYHLVGDEFVFAGTAATVGETLDLLMRGGSE